MATVAVQLEQLWKAQCFDYLDKSSTIVNVENMYKLKHLPSGQLPFSSSKPPSIISSVSSSSTSSSHHTSQVAIFAAVQSDLQCMKNDPDFIRLENNEYKSMPCSMSRSASRTGSTSIASTSIASPPRSPVHGETTENTATDDPILPEGQFKKYNDGGYGNIWAVFTSSYPHYCVRGSNSFLSEFEYLPVDLLGLHGENAGCTAASNVYNSGNYKGNPVDIESGGGGVCSEEMELTKGLGKLLARRSTSDKFSSSAGRLVPTEQNKALLQLFYAQLEQNGGFGHVVLELEQKWGDQSIDMDAIGDSNNCGLYCIHAYPIPVVPTTTTSGGQYPSRNNGDYVVVNNSTSLSENSDGIAIGAPRPPPLERITEGGRETGTSVGRNTGSIVNPRNTNSTVLENTFTNSQTQTQTQAQSSSSAKAASSWFGSFKKSTMSPPPSASPTTPSVFQSSPPTPNEPPSTPPVSIPQSSSDGAFDSGLNETEAPVKFVFTADEMQSVASSLHITNNYPLFMQPSNSNSMMSSTPGGSSRRLMSSSMATLASSMTTPTAAVANIRHIKSVVVVPVGVLMPQLLGRKKSITVLLWPLRVVII